MRNHGLVWFRRLVVAVLGFGVSGVAVTAPRFDPDPSFLRYFAPVDTLRFDQPGLVLGEITAFVGLDSACAVFDYKGHQLYYVDLARDSAWALTLEDSLPGVRLDVMGLERYDRDSFVATIAWDYVVLLGPEGVRRAVNLRGVQARCHFATAKGEVFLLENPAPGDMWIARVDLRTGREQKLFSVPEVTAKLPNLIYRNSRNGGLLFYPGLGFYVANAYQNVIYDYDMSGRLIRVLRSGYHDYKTVPKDAPDPSPASVMRLIFHRKEPFDAVDRIFALNDRTILATYAYHRKLTGELFDVVTGKPLNHKPFRVPFLPVWAGKNRLFLRLPLEASDAWDIQNPGLVVFEYRGR